MSQLGSTFETINWQKKLDKEKADLLEIKAKQFEETQTLKKDLAASKESLEKEKLYAKYPHMRLRDQIAQIETKGSPYEREQLGGLQKELGVMEDSIQRKMLADIESSEYYAKGGGRSKGTVTTGPKGEIVRKTQPLDKYEAEQKAEGKDAKVRKDYLSSVKSYYKGEEAEFLQYAIDNPDDPKTPKILKKLGLKIW